MRMAAGLPSISAGSKVNCRAACDAASSKAAPADCATATWSTVPAALIAIWSTTDAARPAAFSLSGYGASTKCARRGGRVSLCAPGGDAAAGCARTGPAAARVATTDATAARRWIPRQGRGNDRRLKTSRREVEADIERRRRGLAAAHRGLEGQRARGRERRLVEP